MTQEDKELLLKDLSARLPYYPKCEMVDEIRVVNNEKDSSYTECLFPRHLEIFYFHNNFTIKPYLRPLSSMTDEERKEIGNLIRENRPNPYGIINNKGVDNLLFSVSVTSTVLIDWLNAHHFDYRGLIEKGLAIAVTEENNPYEKEQKEK